MSEVTYTPGGDYDSGNSIATLSLQQVQPTDTVQLGRDPDGNFVYDTPSLGADTAVLDASSNDPVTSANGIKADFSDNVAGVTLTGGDAGDILIGGIAHDVLAAAAATTC